jgi:predicted Zn-dependent protease
MQQSRIVHGPVEDWVNIVGHRLAAVSDPEFTYTFHVIDSPEINAFALPGGFVFVYTGLRKVAHTDDELAAVMAHEITHAERHHFAIQSKKDSRRGLLVGLLGAFAGRPNVAQQALSMLDFSVTQKYSRESETEADNLGMKRMVRAGFDPHAMIDLLKNLAAEDEGGSALDKWFRDHPDAQKRIDRAQTELGELPALQAQHNPDVKAAFPVWTPATLTQLAGLTSVTAPPPAPGAAVLGSANSSGIIVGANGARR